ncbi:MAG: tetraacyldisaccharide 4'-kinase, partial [Nitrospiraceae bacterium]|nr:tetraacyldisaccharide 4'-kinase [Nitrospiraceae bacterium]
MTLFELLYFVGCSAKKYYSIKNQKRLPCKVISIGNITTGGTGKTPAVIALAENLKNKGMFPVVLTRGYKGRAKDPCFVENKTPAENFPSYMLFGDEPVLMGKKLKDVPIIKSADRYKGGMFALDNIKADSDKIVFILDDGFQHWKLYRDKNILLIDAENPFGNRKLLPMGILREPLKEIRRAHIILITKKKNIDEEQLNLLIEEIKTYNPDAGIFFSEHKPVGFIKQSGENLPLDWAKDKDILALCAIA